MHGQTGRSQYSYCDRIYLSDVLHKLFFLCPFRRTLKYGKKKQIKKSTQNKQTNKKLQTKPTKQTKPANFPAASVGIYQLLEPAVSSSPLLVHLALRRTMVSWMGFFGPSCVKIKHLVSRTLEFICSYF